jgi:sugar lactone lactonase YvrE
MSAYTIECVLRCENHLGEGPVWDIEEGRLYWVDGTGRRVGKPSIWRMDPRNGKVENWSLEHDVGAMALRRHGGAVLALDDGFYLFDFETARLDLIDKVEVDQPRTRLNDGKCDRRGRFFAGGMDDKEELKICGLWRLDPDLSVTRVDDGIICSNGPCWSPDDKTFYFADTFQEEIWAYDYDIEAGRLSNKRVFASTREDSGVADGSTVDAEGCLWNAQLISGDLVRYAPDGTVERRIGMPVRNITSVIFGGERLDEIYVTSMARVKHPAVHDHFRAEQRPQFGAGSLFRVRGLGIRGIPEPRFAG